MVQSGDERGERGTRDGHFVSLGGERKLSFLEGEVVRMGTMIIRKGGWGGLVPWL